MGNRMEKKVENEMDTLGFPKSGLPFWGVFFHEDYSMWGLHCGFHGTYQNLEMSLMQSLKGGLGCQGKLEIYVYNLYKPQSYPSYPHYGPASLVPVTLQEGPSILRKSSACERFGFRIVSILFSIIPM